MKEHLVSLHGLSIKENAFESKAYIESLMPLKVDFGADEVSRTGNIVVDSLLNYKCALAKTEGIVVHAKVFLPPTLPFQGGHITIIIGNLLENALEACREVEEGKRFIDIDLSYEKGMFFTYGENPFEGIRRQDRNGIFRSTKNDPKNHGIGLQSVMDTANRYHGELVTECNDGVFISTVILYDEC